MKHPDSFHDFVVYDLLSEVGGIRSRRMFGGWGIYCDPIFFAIIFENQLYLKAGAALAEDFKKGGSEQFVYDKKQGKQRKQVAMSYFSVPEDVLEDREEFLRWVTRSITSISKKL